MTRTTIDSGTTFLNSMLVVTLPLVVVAATSCTVKLTQYTLYSTVRTPPTAVLDQQRQFLMT